MKHPIGALVTLAWLLVAAPALAKEAAPKRLLFFTKSASYEHAVIKTTDGQPSVAQRTLDELGVKHGFVVTHTKDGSVFTPEGLKGFDGFIFFTSGDLTTPGIDKNPPMPADGKATLLQAIAGGKGVHRHPPGHRHVLQPGRSLAGQRRRRRSLHQDGGRRVHPARGAAAGAGDLRRLEVPWSDRLPGQAGRRLRSDGGMVFLQEPGQGSARAAGGGDLEPEERGQGQRVPPSLLPGHLDPPRGQGPRVLHRARPPRRHLGQRSLPEPAGGRAFAGRWGRRTRT